jgi:hypothetical protein
MGKLDLLTVAAKMLQQTDSGGSPVLRAR